MPSPNMAWPCCPAVLKSDRAVKMSILVVRAFVKLRELLANNKELARKIEQLEATQKQYAGAMKHHALILEGVVKDIQRIKNPPMIRAIGFIIGGRKKK
jgi:hypothetical protein